MENYLRNKFVELCAGLEKQATFQFGKLPRSEEVSSKVTEYGRPTE